MSSGNPSLAARNEIYAIVPQTINNTSVSSAWIPLSDALRVSAIVLVGATDTTVDAKLEQATDSSGTGAKDVTDAAITQLTATDDNKYTSIDLPVSKVDIGGGFDYVRLTVTVGSGTTGATVAGVVCVPQRHKPPTQPAAYAEQVEVGA